MGGKGTADAKVPWWGGTHEDAFSWERRADPSWCCPWARVKGAPAGPCGTFWPCPATPSKGFCGARGTPTPPPGPQPGLLGPQPHLSGPEWLQGPRRPFPSSWGTPHPRPSAPGPGRQQPLRHTELAVTGSWGVRPAMQAEVGVALRPEHVRGWRGVPWGAVRRAPGPPGTGGVAEAAGARGRRARGGHAAHRASRAPS